MVIFNYIVLILSIKKHKPMYTTWFVISIIINTSMSYPISIGRYFSCVIPAFMFLADYCEKKSKANMFFTVIFAVLFGIFFTEYLNWKHIM